jgi:hypothetical protein
MIMIFAASRPARRKADMERQPLGQWGVSALRLRDKKLWKPGRLLRVDVSVFNKDSMWALASWSKRTGHLH